MRLTNTLFALLACVFAAGCPLVQDPIEPVVSGPDTTEPLRELITRTLDENLHNRVLSTKTHGAWQILHGVLAYGDQFTIETPEGQEPAVEYLLNGKAVNGFEPTVGDLIGNTQHSGSEGSPSQRRESQRPGLRMEMQPGTKTGQGHRDQKVVDLVKTGPEGIHG